MKAAEFLQIGRRLRADRVSEPLTMAVIAINQGFDRPYRLAEATGASCASCTGIIREGVKRGFVLRTPIESDLRGTELSLTEKGKEWLSSIFPE